MREETNQTISRLIDSDLGYDETLALLQKMQLDDRLKAKMVRYQAISHAIKTESFCQVSPDFGKNISRRIQQEPNYLIPHRKPTEPIKDSIKYKYFAAAASALIAAVLVGKQFGTANPSTSTGQVAQAIAAPQQALPANLAKLDKTGQPNRQPRIAQFNDYLQAHNSSVYINGEANFHPYAKMAVYGR